MEQKTRTATNENEQTMLWMDLDSRLPTRGKAQNWPTNGL